MPITLSDTTISGLGVGGLPSGTVNSTTLADGSVTRAKMGYAGAVLQTTYNYYGPGSYSGTNNWTNVTTVTITPSSTANGVFLFANIPATYSPGHGGSGRWLRNGSTFNLTGDSNRQPAHGGEEGVNSDGGSNFPVNVVDYPSTTSAITYTLQVAAETSGTSRWGTASNNYSDQNVSGYPGVFRTYVMAMEIKG